MNNDRDIVNIYYAYRDYGNYNTPSFRKSLINANTLLGIEVLVNKLATCNSHLNDYVKFAETEYKDALNNMHSLIHNLSATTVGQQYLFNNGLKNLKRILLKRFDNIKRKIDLLLLSRDIKTDNPPTDDYETLIDDTHSVGYNPHFSLF